MLPSYADTISRTSTCASPCLHSKEVFFLQLFTYNLLHGFCGCSHLAYKCMQQCCHYIEVCEVCSSDVSSFGNCTVLSLQILQPGAGRKSLACISCDHVLNAGRDILLFEPHIVYRFASFKLVPAQPKSQARPHLTMQVSWAKYSTAVRQCQHANGWHRAARDAPMVNA